MSHEQKQNLISYFPLAFAIISFAISWGVFSTKLNAEEETIQTQDVRINTLEKVLTDLRIDTATIKSDVSYIKSHIQ